MCSYETYGKLETLRKKWKRRAEFKSRIILPISSHSQLWVKKLNYDRLGSLALDDSQFRRKKTEFQTIENNATGIHSGMYFSKAKQSHHNSNIIKKKICGEP